MNMWVKVTQLCPNLCKPMDYTAIGILQARILKWVAFPFSRGSSQPRDWSQVSHIAGGFFTNWTTRRHEFEHILGDSEGQGSLACCSHEVAKSWTQLSNWKTTTTTKIKYGKPWKHSYQITVGRNSTLVRTGRKQSMKYSRKDLFQLLTSRWCCRNFKCHL